MESRPFIYPERCMPLCRCWQPNGSCARASETNIARPQIWCSNAGCERIPDSPYFKHKPECYWGNPRLLVIPVEFDEHDDL